MTKWQLKNVKTDKMSDILVWYKICYNSIENKFIYV